MLGSEPAHRHIAVVGRRAVETDRPEDRAVGLFIEHRASGHVETQPAARGRHLRRPQPGCLHLGPHALQRALGDVAMRVEIGAVGLQRNDLGVNEGADLFAIFLDLRA
jgi:hypothetical protein